MTDDEETITRLCIAYNSIYCEQPEEAKNLPEVMRRAILPIIKAERIRGGEMVKEAAGIAAQGTWAEERIRALSVPAIVEAGEHQPKENTDG